MGGRSVDARSDSVCLLQTLVTAVLLLAPAKVPVGQAQVTRKPNQMAPCPVQSLCNRSGPGSGATPLGRGLDAFDWRAVAGFDWLPKGLAPLPTVGPHLCKYI